MKKNYQAMALRLDLKALRMLKFAVCLSFLLMAIEGRSQCSINFTPATSCASADQIQTFTLNGIAAVGNGGCSANAYGLFNTPVWTLFIGQTYTWTITNGPTWTQGVALWIDLNNDGILTANEQLGNDPAGLIHTGSFTIPLSATGATNVRMRIRCQYNATIGNTNTTACDSWTFGETEDYFVDLIPPTPCNNTPVANSLISPTYALCAGSSAQITLANTYTLANLTYTWSVASNSVGPFVAVPNATNASYSANNVSVSNWYQLSVSCPGFGSTTLVGPNQVMVAATVTNNIPYFEGFEGINNTDDLPNCSWARSTLNMTPTYTVANTQNRVPRTGSKFASFYYSPAGTNYFYTNGLQLYAGVTYSASMWYTTEYYGYNNFDLAMMIGPNQAPAGMVAVANQTYATSPNYKSLSNTFSVPTSGIYYMAIRAIGNAACCGAYLSWDDLSIIIPCSLNTPTMTINSAGSTTICQGQTVNLAASGLDTYTWSTNANTSSISDMPNYNTTYMATGTNTITNCTAMATKNIVVNPTPQVNIVPSATAVCDGSSVNLIAFGATNYTWNTANTGPMISVSPTGAPAVTYTVLGSNAFNCIGMNTQVIAVNPLPAVTAQSSHSVACLGEPISLSATGADGYEWISNAAYLQGSPVAVNPAVGVTTYSLTGTDANGCKTTVSIVQQVFNCVGINEHSSLKGLSIYPNPNNGTFNIELKNGLSKTIEIMDVTGRTILTENRAEDLMTLNINNLANGIYYVKVKSDNAVEILKVVKQ